MATISDHPSCPHSKSKVPSHLRPFHRSSFTTEPFLTQPPYSYTLPLSPSPKSKSPPSPTKPEPVELSQPHCPLPTRSHALRTRLKGILLKDLQSHYISKRSHTPRSPSRGVRPATMRMKDSDDYITARAANPRTGLISPSVGSPSSPRYLPETPGSPGEALRKGRSERGGSPTGERRVGPGLRRGEIEGGEKGRGCAGDVSGWFVDENGWLKGGSVRARAEAEVTAVDADAGVWQSGSLRRGRRGEDILTVHMPSAREPQPYAYPGCSAQQIEALKRCVGKKGRRVVSAEMHLHNNHHHCIPGAEVMGSAFAPFSSPRTSASTTNLVSTAMKILPRPNAHENNHLPAHLIPRKPLHNPLSTTSSTDTPIRTLPRVRLLHATAPPPNSSKPRQCSLRCARDASTDLCLAVQHRVASSSSSNATTTSTLTQPLFDPLTTHAKLDGYTEGLLHESEAVSTGQGVWCASMTDILVGVVITLTNVVRHIPVPRSLPKFLNLPLETLTAEHRSPEEKAQALKEVLSAVGQALLLLTITAMVWQVGSAVMRCVYVVFWPLGVVGWVVKWVVIGS